MTQLQLPGIPSSQNLAPIATRLPSSAQGLDSLSVELHLTQLNSKVEGDEHLNAEFFREFADESPAAIQWAFRQHRRESRFMPSISEIAELIRTAYRLERQAQEEAHQVRERREIEAARLAGQLLPWNEILRRFDIACEAHNRNLSLKPRLRGAELEQYLLPLAVESWSPTELRIHKNEELAKLELYLARKKPPQSTGNQQIDEERTA